MTLNGTNTFGDCTSGASGGGVYAKSDTLTISGTTHFENCSATNFGGGIGANSADVNVDGASFANCSTTSAVDLAGYGGAIRAGLGNSKIKIKNTTITGCHAKVGGALSVETAQTTLDTTTITGNNYCDDANQAIVHCKDASLALEGASTITGNKPTSDGKTCSYVVGSDGACQITLGDTTSITGNQFTGGRTGSSAVFMNSASTLSVSGGVQVTGNTDGAAEKNVYLTGSSNNIQVTGDLTDTANIGVTMETEARKAAGQQFGVTTAKPASEVAKLDHLYQDGNTAYVGTAGTDTAVVWKYEPEVCRNQQTQSVYKGDDALAKAVAAAASGDTIEMLVAQYTVPAQIEVDKDLTITKAAGIDSATLTLSTDFKNGTDMFAVSGDGKTFTLKDMALTSSAPNSRAITQNKGTVALKNTTVSGFKRTGNIYGGAVSVTTGTFTMDRSTINACSTASYAGAIQSAKGSTIILTDSTISNCSATNSGGAIYSSDGGDTITMTGGAIDTCSAGSYYNGGAVYMNKVSTLTFDGTTINGCTAGYYGAAVYATGGASVELRNATIQNCSGKGDSSGGAVIDVTGTAKDQNNLTMTDTTVTGCNATSGHLIKIGTTTANINGASNITASACNSYYALVYCSNANLTMGGTASIHDNSGAMAYLISGTGTPTVTLEGQAAIIDNTMTGKYSGYAGAINSNSAMNIVLKDQAAITGNNVVSATSSAGGVYVKDGSSLSVSDSVKVTGNTRGTEASNIYLAGTNNLTVAGSLTKDAILSVTAQNRMNSGDQFGTLTGDATIGGTNFTPDDGSAVQAETNGTSIVWKLGIKSIAFKKEKSGSSEKIYYPQTVYSEGEEFSTADGKITVTYNNNTTQDIDLSECTCTGYDMTKLDTPQTVTVAYQNAQTSYQIIVQKPVSADDPEYKKYISNLKLVLYNQSDSFDDVYDFYHGGGWIISTDNSTNQQPMSSSNSTDGLGWLGRILGFKQFKYYDGTNTVLDTAVGSTLDSHYTWAVIPNNTKAGLDLTKADGYDGGKYGYTIFWCFTPRTSIVNNANYTILTYNTSIGTYGSGSVKGASKSGYYWLDATSLSDVSSQMKQAPAWNVNTTYYAGATVSENAVVYQAVEKTTTKPGTAEGKTAWVIIGTTDGAPAPFDAATQTCGPNVLVTVKETIDVVYKNTSGGTLNTMPPANGWTLF